MLQSRYDSLDSCSGLDHPENSLLADMPGLCHEGPPTPMGMCYAPIPQTPRVRTMPMFSRSDVPCSRELPPFQVCLSLLQLLTVQDFSLNILQLLTPEHAQGRIAECI